MKNISVAVTAGAALVILGAGCYQTRIERQSLSPEEQAWENIIRESYPGYKAPPKTSRSVKGHTESRVSAVIRETPVKAMDDPVEPVPVQQDAPAAENNADKPVIPADPATPPVVEVKADAPAEKPADAPAPAEKPAEPAEKPADAPAPAEKPAPAADKKVVAAPAGNMPPDPTNSTVYVVKSGDTLGSIAQKNYGNARYSNVIFKANSDILKNPDKLRPGMKLIIPKL